MPRTKTFDQEEVLGKAIELFWRQGYNATSASDIVEALGLSRSSIYDTFGSKRGLFTQSLKEYRKRFVGQTIAMIEESDDIKKTIAEIFDLVIAQDITSKVPKGCLMVNSAVELSSEDNEIAAIVNANQRDIESAFETAIQAGIQKGQIAPSHSPASLAKFFYNAISGIRVAIKSKQDKAALDDIVQVTLSVLD